MTSAAPATAPELGAAETERIRTRVRLMVEISARAGKYRGGLAQAATRLTPEEAALLADLEGHGLQVDQLRDVLCGGHVLIDEPTLYERWLFPQASHKRISSHHHDIDKRLYPDIGLRGPLVREKLHGRTAHGTWVQLEKTPAALGARKLPSWKDVQHLMDYFMYRITGRNVGPWGLSALTEKRPMYLSPDLGASTPLAESAGDVLTAALKRIEADDDVTSASAELAARFPPPERADPAAELAITPGLGPGRGLFGGSSVWITETPSAAAREVVSHAPAAPAWSLPPADVVRPATMSAGDGREIECGVRITREPACEDGPQ